jgi:PST family polysaccharide transporter
VRDLGFGVVSISRTAGDLIFTAVAVTTVWAGAGAMGIVYGNLARSIVRLVLLLKLSSWREWIEPAPLRAGTFKTLASYGSLVSLKAGAEFGTRRWDNLLIARYFGPGVAGNYILAYNLADLPAIQIGEQIGDVLLATFGRVDPANRPAAVVRATRLMALVMAPLSVGLGAVGPSLAAAFFPPSWTLLGPMLTLLPIVLLFRPIGAVYAGFLFGVRGPKPVVIGELVGLVSMLLGLALLGRHDPLLFVAMIGVAFLARLCVLMALARISDGVSIRAAVAGLLPILAACVPMFLAVRGLHAALLPWQSPAWSLVLEVAAGALVYAITAPIFARAAVRDAVGLVRGVLARRLPRFAGAR